MAASGRGSAPPELLLGQGGAEEDVVALRRPHVADGNADGPVGAPAAPRTTVPAAGDRPSPVRTRRVPPKRKSFLRELPGWVATPV